MKAFTVIALLMGFVTTVSKASEDFYLKVSRLDGLPYRLLESRLLAKDLASSKGPIDLTPVFNDIGCNIPEGGSVLYDSGGLVRNLDKESHDRVDQIIGSLYRTDELIASGRAYYKLLEPLSAEDRFRTVMRIGFIPDPLVASMFDEIRAIHALEKPNNDPRLPTHDPFEETSPTPKPLSEDETARLRRLEKTASALLEISIRRLQEQLAVADAGKAQASAGQPATTSESKSEGGDKPKPVSEHAPR